MTWIIKLARYNELTASTCGIATNFLLLYLLITVDKTKMKEIRRILFQNCFLDTFLAFTSLFFGLHTVCIDKQYYFIFGSPLRFLGFKFGSIFFAFFVAAIIVCMQAAFIPFYVKYCMICKNKAITKEHLMGSYILVFICFIFMLISMVWCYPPNEEIYEPFKAATLTEFWLEEFPNGPIFVSRKMDIQLFIIVGFMFLTTFISYTLVIVFSVKISQKLKSHTSSFKQSKILYKQLHWTLIAQAIGPIIVGNLPALFLITMMQIGYENNYVSIMLSSTLGWVAVVNPLAAIIIMSPYKKRVKEMLKIGTQLSVINISSNNVIHFNLHTGT